MYGTDIDLMNMTCISFVDMKRINSQVKVAERYLINMLFLTVRYMTMLKEELGRDFGLAFIKNFQLLNHILGK